jgi:uncharacterized peroxidase-related enzyme
MPHIPLPESPGIISLLMHFPETGQHLRALTEALLRGPSSLTAAERELIAAHVSSLNDCTFCMRSHAAAARHLYGDGEREIVDQVRADVQTAPLSQKLRALLEIATQVTRSGRNVSPEDIQCARDAGADDRAIHDTVLIAAAFCMFNRYVDGLATWTPEDERMYDLMGERLARHGYLPPQP